MREKADVKVNLPEFPRPRSLRATEPAPAK